MNLARQLLAAWGESSTTPAGRAAFDQRLAETVPYSGTIEPHVLELSPGHAVVAMDDRPEVRNHLDSIHAVALMNLGEVASGLAVLTSLPLDARAILVGLQIEYHKKARGRLVARSHCELVADNEEQRLTAPAQVNDEQGDEVATITAHWAVGPQ